MRAIRAGSAPSSAVNFSLEHVGLSARDPLTLKDWYARTLGARIQFQTEAGAPSAMFLLLLPGGGLIEIYQADAAPGEPNHNKLAGWRHLALRVQSIEVAKAELERRGVAFAEPVKPAGGGGRVLFFKDPEGNLLHLVERDVKMRGT